jgi:plastocyanin
MRATWIMFTSVFFLSMTFQGKSIPVIHEVRMEDMSFSPRVIEIRVGETVRWVNRSNSTHNVVANDKSFKSKMLPSKGDQFEFTFKSAGEFHYFCQPHKLMGMKGLIIVKK